MNILRSDSDFINFLAKFICRLNYEFQNGALIVVEGKNDALALSSLGFSGEIFTYCNNNTLSKLADKALLYKKTILLFDYDHQGRYLTSRAMKTLERRSLIDVTYRRELSSASRGRIRTIEELNKFPDNPNNNCYI